MDRFRVIGSFVEVAAQRSFTAAAEKLGVSRSMISKHVKELEDSLGVRLLHRTTQQVRLTEAGEAYFDLCTRIVGELAEADVMISEISQNPRGVLRILAPRSFGLIHLARLIHDFSALYPDIQVSLMLDDTRQDLVSSGFDLAIRIGELDDSRLIARKVCITRWIACASPDYIARYGEPQRPEDLVNHNCLTHTRITPDQVWRFNGPAGSTSVKVSGTVTSNSGLVLVEGVRGGRGISLLPTYLLHPDLGNGTVRRVLADYHSLELPLCLVYPSNRYLALKVRCFVNFAAEQLRNLGD
jgi:DNA-binding transcriptional LysR family regulator